MKKTRININLPVDLINHVKFYSKVSGLDFTTTTIILLNVALNILEEE